MPEAWRFSVDNTEQLVRPDRRGSRQEIVAVAIVVPHHIRTRFIGEGLNDVAIAIVNDGGRMVSAGGAVAAEKDLMIRADRHALRGLATGKRDNEGCLHLFRYRIDHRHAAGTRRLAGDPRDGDVELAGAMIPLALLSAVVRVRRAARSVKRNLLHNGIGDGRNQTSERRRIGIVRRHNQMMPRVEAHFIRTIDAPRGDNVRDCARKQINYLDRAVTVSHPHLVVADGHHAVGTGRIVVSGEADEFARELCQDRIGGGVDDIDRFIGAVAQDVDPGDGIDETDIERLNFLPARKRDDCRRSERLVGSRYDGCRKQDGRRNRKRSANRRTILRHRFLPVL